MSVTAQMDEIRAQLTGPGAPFEIVEGEVRGHIVPLYKNLPPNITHLFQQAIDRYGDRTFLVLNDRRLTFAETIGQAASLAEVLKREYGLEPGDRVAVAMRNTPDWVVAFFAALLAGGCTALINSRGAPDELLHAVHHTDCRIVIADRRRAESIAPGFKGALLVSDDQGNFTDHATGRALELKPAELKVTDAKPDDPCLILFTSGTTGRPKGAVLDHRGCYSCIFTLGLNQATALAWNAKKLGMPVEKLAAAAAGSQASFFGIFPFFHTSGSQAMILGSLGNGGKLVMLDRWDPDAALKVILKERISSVILPPSALWDLIAHPELPNHDLSFVTTVGTGGQATPPNLHAAYMAAFSKATAGSAYGQSETNGGITAARGDEYKAGCAGRVFPIVRMKIVDDDGAELPLGEVGEICVKSVLNMVGYWNQQDATDAAFLPDGWLRTGDIGFLDAENYITIVDRKKDMIIRGGENIYCAELERVFHDCPGVLETACFGAPDDKYGEKVVLAVVPHDGVELSAEEILAFGKARLADYKIPSEVLVTREHFQRNAMGKVDRNALRKAYATQG